VYKLSLILLMLFSVACTQTPAPEDFSQLPEMKQTPQALYVTAVQAYEIKTQDPDNVFLVDVRTQGEIEFLGMAETADVNIPYMFNDFSEWDPEKHRYLKVPNSNFSITLEEKLEKAGLNKETTILLMCRSGTRSAKAANLLNQLGYTKAYTVVDGYEGDKVKEGIHKGQHLVNGWKNADLPWSYTPEKEKLYIQYGW
jgi:rhodanese-related sulfurtransferase